MDQTIKRALFITFLVVVVAKLSSAMFDGFMSDTQNEMIENQQAYQENLSDLATSQSQAKAAAARAARCQKVMRSERCTHPTSYREIGRCLGDMKMAGCRELPRVDLCAAVEELERCADPFADPKRSGCRDLRRIADCKHHPAAADREGLWRIELDDGMWRGDE